MARPISSEKRTKRLHTLYSDTEHKQMVNNARDARMRPGEYSRFMTIGVKPDKLLPTREREEMLKGISAVQQISKNLDLIFREGKISEDILIMVRTELMAVGQLITKGLK